MTITRFVAFFLFFFSHGVWAATLQGSVLAVIDGDTFTFVDAGRVQHRVRLFAIDAPERSQPFGNHAQTHLSAMLAGRNVQIERIRQDGDGLLLGKVLLCEPKCVDVGLEQIKAGMAWHQAFDTRGQTPKDREEYAIAEFNARIRRLGLWNDRNPVSPWEWRAGLRRGG